MANIHDGYAGRTCSVLSHQAAEPTSRQSSKRSSASSSRRPRCLCLRAASGLMPTYTWETDGAWLTELSTRNSSESPSAVAESTLSQILQANVPEQYSLSAKACQGIIRRAATRGKELPLMLKTALERQ